MKQNRSEVGVGVAWVGASLRSQSRVYATQISASKFLTDLVKTFGGQTVFIFLQFVATIAVARALLPDALGLYTASVIVVGAVTFAGDLQIQASAVRASGNDLVLAWSATVWSMLLTVSYAAVLVLAGSRLFALLELRRYEQGQLFDLLEIAVAAMFVKSITTAPMVLLSRRLQFSSIAGGQIALACANAGLTVALALMLRSASALAWSILAGQLAQLAYLTWSIRADVRGVCSVARAGKLVFGPFASFGVYGAILALFAFVVNNVDNATVVRSLGAAALGAYAMAYNLARWVDGNISTVVTRVLFPTLVRDLRTGDRSRWVSTLPRVLTIVTALCCVASGLIFLMAPFAIPRVLGGRWTIDGSLLQVLAFDGFFAPFVNIVGNALLSAGRIRDVVVYSFVHLVIMVCALVLLSGPFGLMGVALSEVLGGAGATICVCWIFWRYAGSDALAGLAGALPWGGVLAATMVSYYLVRLWLPPGGTPSDLTLASAVGAVVLVSASCLLGSCQAGWLRTRTAASALPCKRF